MTEFDADLVRAIVDKVKAEIPGHTWVSGTVTRAVSDAGFSSVVELVLDGDVTETVIQATNLTAVPMVGGARVKVVFDPPQGVYVLGVISTDIIPMGRLEYSTYSSAPSDVQWACATFLSGGMTFDGTSLIVPIAGTYSITCRIKGGGSGSFSMPGDYAVYDSVNSVGPVLLASAMVPLTVGSPITVQAGPGLGSASQSSEFPGHLEAVYVAPFAGLPGSCVCSSG